MDEVKRKIITREIDYWRKSRLLPEQYCDFLMNLYMEGGDEQNDHGAFQTLSTKRIRNSHWKMWLIWVLIFTFISLIALNFNVFHMTLQIGIAAGVVSVLYILGYRFKLTHPASSTVYNGLGTLIMLFLGEYILWLHNLTEMLYTIGFLVISSLFWVGYGILSRTIIIQLCGWLGFMLFYGWLLYYHQAEIHWLEAQMMWLPWTAIFIWLGWLLHQKHRSSSVVFLVMGSIIWFVPEGFSYIVISPGISGDWLQGAFVFKLVMAAIILFGFRKKWTDWVAAQ